MKVFIDSVTYIKLFEGNPSLDYFKSLKKLLSEKKITLIFPKITRNEVYRHVAEILKKEKEEPKLIFPPTGEIFRDKKITDRFKKLESDYTKFWKKEYKKLKSRNLQAKRLMAEELFNSFQKLTIDYPETSEVFKLANERKEKRYSPGKPEDALGDQLAWEILFKNCTDDDLMIVSVDGDWKDLTDIKNNKINPLLLQEWEKKSDKKIILLGDLGELISKFEKEYKIPEVEKEKVKPRRLNFPVYPISFTPTTTTTTSTSSVGFSPVSASGTFSNFPTVPTSSPVSGASISGSSVIYSRSCPNCGVFLYFIPDNNICPICGAYIP